MAEPQQIDVIQSHSTVPIETPESIEASKPLVEPTRKGELGYMDDIEYHRIADALDISYEDRKVATIATKLSFLYDWAKETTKSDDRITRIEAIRSLQRSLGIQGKGLETIKKLYQYARLDQDRRRIEREMAIIQ